MNGTTNDHLRFRRAGCWRGETRKRVSSGMEVAGKQVHLLRMRQRMILTNYPSRDRRNASKEGNGTVSFAVKALTSGLTVLPFATLVVAVDPSWPLDSSTSVGDSSPYADRPAFEL